MRNDTLKHTPIMPIAAKPSQYGIDPSLVKKRVAELPGMCSLQLTELFRSNLCNMYAMPTTS